MNTIVCQGARELGQRAATEAAANIRQAIQERGCSHVVFATGASQFEVLDALVAAPGIDWPLVVGFHLDEYVGLPPAHPASFCRYLRSRLVERAPIGDFHFINGESSPHAECRRIGDLIRHVSIDVALVGIGENGHLAFNDPPADFQTESPYLLVELDEACRRQQWGEGWFPAMDAVPRQAISMSIRQIMKSRAIVCSVPDRRKAEAVKAALQGPVTPQVPASILQHHNRVTVYLDPSSASLIKTDS